MKKNKTLLLITIVICTLTFMLMLQLQQNGGISKNGTKGTETYSTIEDVRAKTSLDMTIPEGIDTSKILEIRSTMGQLVEIRAEHYIMKAAKFIDVNADPMGLYDESEVDNKYSVSNSSITFMRYRTGYTEYESCTILNWCNETTSIGVMFDDIYTEDEVLSIMGLTKDDIQLYTEGNGQSSKANENIIWNTHTIADGALTIDIPDTESSLESLEFDGYTILFLNKNRCLVVVYDDYNVDADTFGGQGQIDIDEHTRLNYLKENEFKEGTEEYRDYTIILNNIQSIADSIKRN